MCHRDALVFASVPLHVRVVHVERASLVADILVAVRREICPVVPPEAFRLDACQAKCIQLVWPFGKQILQVGSFACLTRQNLALQFQVGSLQDSDRSRPD